MQLTRRYRFIVPVVLLLAACSSTTQEGTTGVKRKQLMLLPSAQVDAMSLESYKGELSKAAGAGKLNTDKANLERVRVIADRLVPHVATFRSDAVSWQWEVNLETRDELNAYCAPGGKIMFFTGIIKKLELTDAEIAAIMGMFSAIMGGVIRDVLTNETPVLFRKEIYATACLMGAILYLVLYRFDVDRNINLLISSGIILIIRFVAVKYHLALPNFKR